MFVYVFLVLLLTHCAHQGEYGDATKTIASTSDAERFDKLIQGKLSTHELQQFQESCRGNLKFSLFCPSFARFHTLERRIKAKQRRPVLTQPPVIPPTTLVIENQKVIGWSEIRKANVKSIVKGMRGMSLEQLRVISRAALKEGRCPNNAAIASAATLEEQLPNSVTPTEVARLYDKGANCARREPLDREHYLTRAGLLFYQYQQYSNAAQYLQRATRIRDAYVARPLYWWYRTLGQLRRNAKQREVFEQLTRHYAFDFHTLLALTENKKDPAQQVLRAGPGAALPRRSQRHPGINSLIEQAETLRQQGFTDSSEFMGAWALEEGTRVEFPVKLYIAQLADGYSKVTWMGDFLNSDPNRVSRTMLEISFPRVYLPLFERHAAQIDPLFLLSFARQESIFNASAVSVANAQGLMQLTPETASKLSSAELDLLDPETNIRMGARHIHDLIDRFKGKTSFAVAAYNAGEEKMGAWAERYETKDRMLLIDLISYRETRSYVGAVLRNYYWYRRLYSSQGSDIELIDPNVVR